MKPMQKILVPLRKLSEILGKIMSVVVLTLLYIFGIGPLALLGKIFRKDFIGEKRRETPTYWLHYQEKDPTIENFLKPY